MNSVKNILKTRRVQFFLRFYGLFLTIFILWRLAFFFFFFNADTASSFGDLIKGFLIGVQFDSRLTIICFFPLLFATLFPIVNIVRSKFVRFIAQFYMWVVSVFLLIIYSFDFGYYEYLNRRIDITILNFFTNPDIAVEMMKESYPIFWILLAVIAYLYVLHKSIKWVMKSLKYPQNRFDWKIKTGTILVFAMIYLLASWQSFSQYPLRWSKAYFTNHTFTFSLALNPVLFFYDTFSFLDSEYDEQKAIEHYSWVKQNFSLKEDQMPLNYERVVNHDALKNKPNIVIVLLETFPLSYVKKLGNPLNTTPFIDDLLTESILFENFYVPAHATARSVFSVITGIPDVSRADTSTRNPLIAKQNTLVNALEGYEKFYMIGGSASWANIRSLLTYNIPDLKLYEKEDFDAPHTDVWGICDYDLLDLTVDKLQALSKEKPFFAMIQTATNHSPFTIPKHLTGFEVHQDIPIHVLHKAGFNRKNQELAQYNAVRLLDYSIKHFMKKMQEKGLAENTIFYFFGDHGTYATAAHMEPSYEYLGRSNFQVLSFMYAPRFVRKGQVVSTLATLADILPTVLGMAQVSYKNKTLGRDLLAPNANMNTKHKAMFVDFKQAKTQISVVGQEYLMRMYKDGSKAALYRLNDSQATNHIKKHPELAEEYKQTGLSLYETAKYMLYHP